jgi:site-specific DNA recombinase
MPGGTSAAAWDPVLPREDWETACAMLDGRGGYLAPAHNARKYLLSGIATCGTCGATLQVLPARASGPARYMCRADGCGLKVYRDLALLDGYVSARVVRRLNDPATPPGRLPATPGLAGELRALAAEREQVEAAVADHTKGRLPLLLARLDSLDTRLAEIRELTGASAQAILLRRHAGLSLTEFAALQLGTRRALVSGCYKVVVLPASARGPGFRPQDVMLTPRWHVILVGAEDGDGAGHEDGDAEEGDDEGPDDMQMGAVFGWPLAFRRRLGVGARGGVGAARAVEQASQLHEPRHVGAHLLNLCA